MMDEELRILHRIDLPAELGALDDYVIGTVIARRRETAAIRRLMILVALVSLGGGIAVGSAIPGAALAASPLNPFEQASALAPSTLLDLR